MITKLSHAPIWVDDHDTAVEFYVDTLGFEIRTDQTLEGFRWLTVAPKGQHETEIVLMELGPSPMMDDATVAQLRELLHKGAMGAGVLATDDCRATYESLAAKGVEFLEGPTERPYGVEAIMKDPFGNWFSLTGPPATG